MGDLGGSARRGARGRSSVRWLTFAFTVLVVALTSATARAAEPLPDQGQISIAPDPPSAAADSVVHAAGCYAGGTIEAFVATSTGPAQQVAHVAATVAGDGTGSIVVPTASLPTGSYVLDAGCQTDELGNHETSLVRFFGVNAPVVEPTFSLDSTTLTPGSTFTVTVTDCFDVRGHGGVLSVFGPDLSPTQPNSGIQEADSSGFAQATFPVPSSTPASTTIKAFCIAGMAAGQGHLVGMAHIEATNPSGPPSPPTVLPIVTPSDNGGDGDGSVAVIRGEAPAGQGAVSGLGAGAPANAGELPRTGRWLGAEAGGGAAVVALGLVLVAAARRRRTNSA